MNRVSKEERMQRIRIGLTGLAVVFLFVLLGTAISRSSEDNVATPEQNELQEPSEPLAEIGAGTERAAGRDRCRPRRDDRE